MCEHLVESHAGQLQLTDAELLRLEQQVVGLETELQEKDSEVVVANRQVQDLTTQLSEVDAQQIPQECQRCGELALELVEIDWQVKLKDSQVKSLTKRAALGRLHHMEAEDKLTVAKVWRLLW